MKVNLGRRQRAHRGTATNGGGAEMPLCPDFPSGERNAHACIAVTISPHPSAKDYGAARQRRPTEVAVSRCTRPQPCHQLTDANRTQPFQWI